MIIKINKILGGILFFGYGSSLVTFIFHNFIFPVNTPELKYLIIVICIILFGFLTHFLTKEIDKPKVIWGKLLLPTGICAILNGILFYVVSNDVRIGDIMSWLVLGVLFIGLSIILNKK
jgi:hypothetical protein|tara:strand:- start:15014 stop:15370 length:357 start_codon:yes stop_codon:yes gene_type:complete